MNTGAFFILSNGLALRVYHSRTGAGLLIPYRHQVMPIRQRNGEPVMRCGQFHLLGFQLGGGAFIHGQVGGAIHLESAGAVGKSGALTIIGDHMPGMVRS